MEYRTITMDYCIFQTGRDLKEMKMEYTVQVPATTFSAGFMFTIWINDEDDMKKHEIIKQHIMEQIALEHNTVRCLRQDLYDAEEELSNAAEEYSDLKNELKEAKNNAEYYRQKYLEKVNECEDLKATLKIARNNTEYFKKKLAERESSLMEYAKRENASKAFEEEQSEAINALRQQILELQKKKYLFCYVKHIKLKELDLELTYKMEYVQLKNDYLYHFIIEDDQVSYLPSIYFHQRKRDDAEAIEYAQNLLNNEVTLYRKMRILEEKNAYQEARIRRLEKTLEEYCKKAQGNY